MGLAKGRILKKPAQEFVTCVSGKNRGPRNGRSQKFPQNVVLYKERAQCREAIVDGTEIG